MAREVPVAAAPFPVLVNETTTKQAPVAGSALVEETVVVTAPSTAFAVIAG